MFESSAQPPGSQPLASPLVILCPSVSRFLLFPPIRLTLHQAQQLAMTTLIPREKYTADELERLYPKELALHQVQVVCI